MKPLDLRKHAPRAPREQLGGLCFLPRTIDKIRGDLPGGNPGAYFINSKITGLSGHMLERLGISEEEMREAVVRAESDEDVLAFVRERVSDEKLVAIDAFLKRVELKHVPDREYFDGVYAETLRARPDLVVLLDVIEEDDRRAFA